MPPDSYIQVNDLPFIRFEKCVRKQFRKVNNIVSRMKALARRRLLKKEANRILKTACKSVTISTGENYLKDKNRQRWLEKKNLSWSLTYHPIT